MGASSSVLSLEIPLSVARFRVWHYAMPHIYVYAPIPPANAAPGETKLDLDLLEPRGSSRRRRRRVIPTSP